MALVLSHVPGLLDDEAIERFSHANPGWQIEVSSTGDLIVSPTYSDSGARELAAGVQLQRFAERAGGMVFGSSAGFRLADGSLKSPDASWMSPEHLDRLTADQKSKFWKTCPDIVLEVLSETDDWSELLAKMDVYRANGAAYTVAIDPYSRRVQTSGVAPAGLELDIDAIVSAA